MRPMRRKDREMPKEFAEAIIEKCEYFVMATVGPGGEPYCVPLSLAREGDWLYFHCAHEGHKIENLKFQNKVCISCVGETSIPRGNFTVEYESALVFGTARECESREEKIQGLKIICQRWTPLDMEAFEEAMEKSLDATAVWKIHIDDISAKCRPRIG